MSEKRLVAKPPRPGLRRLILVLVLVIAVLAITAAVLLAVYRGWAKPPPTPSAPVRPSHQTEVTGAPADSDRKEGWYTFLVVGFDKVGANTDTMMVVGCDTLGRKISVMNIPRDTMVNVPWDIKRINSVYAYSGIEGLCEQVAALIGFLPDYYITIDLEAFGRLVDEIGGVTFNVPINMYYDDPFQDLHIRQSKGERLLKGADAMQVARFRINNDNTGYPMGDIDRIATQQALLTAIAKQCLKLSNLTKISAFMEIFNENVDSDLDLGNMVWFAEQLVRMDTDKDLHFFTLPGNYSATAYSRTYKSMQSYVTPKEGELVEQINLYLNPYKEPVEPEDLDLMSVSSSGKISASSGKLADTKANDAVGARQSSAPPSPSPSPSPTPSPSPSPEPSGELPEETEPPETPEEPGEPEVPRAAEPGETEPEPPPTQPEPAEPTPSPSGIGFLPPMPKPVTSP